MADYQFLEHLYASAHIVVGVNLLAQLHVAVDEVDVRFLQHDNALAHLFYLLFIVLLVHIFIIRCLTACILCVWQRNTAKLRKVESKTKKLVPFLPRRSNFSEAKVTKKVISDN